ncbi:MAG: YciI family protein [Stellaceae bacterium]
MPDFILLLHHPASAPPAVSFSPERKAAVTKEYMAWGDRLRAEGRLKAGEKLTVDAGRVLRAAGDRIMTTDGPFAESKELLGGFFLIAARDYDEACRTAESCPHFKYGGSIEVRQIDPMKG